MTLDKKLVFLIELAIFKGILAFRRVDSMTCLPAATGLS